MEFKPNKIERAKNEFYISDNIVRRGYYIDRVKYVDTYVYLDGTFSKSNDMRHPDAKMWFLVYVWNRDKSDNLYILTDGHEWFHAELRPFAIRIAEDEFRLTDSDIQMILKAIEIGMKENGVEMQADAGGV